MEIRHNGAFVMRGNDAEVEAWKKGHPEMEGIEVGENRPFELHADEKEHGSFIDSFASLDEARKAHEQFSTPQGGGEGVDPQPAQFPGAEIRNADDGAVVHPLPAVAELAAPEEPPALEGPPASEATTDPAPPEPPA